MILLLLGVVYGLFGGICYMQVQRSCSSVIVLYFTLYYQYYYNRTQAVLNLKKKCVTFMHCLIRQQLICCLCLIMVGTIHVFLWITHCCCKFMYFSLTTWSLYVIQCNFIFKLKNFFKQTTHTRKKNFCQIPRR